MSIHSQVIDQINEEKLPIAGMTCASCVKRIETAISKIEGVRDVFVLVNALRLYRFNAPASNAAIAS